jgi:hypothetical protein
VYQLTALHAACEASFLKDLQWTADCRVPLELEKTELQLKLETLAEVRVLNKYSRQYTYTYTYIYHKYLIVSCYWCSFLLIHL